MFTFGGSVGPPAHASPPPRTLVEVIGIGETETVNGVPITFLSMERYVEGDVITFRLIRKRGRWERDYPSPELFLKVGPASATATPRFTMMSGGGGGMDELVFRYTFGFTPGMPDDATDWVVEVEKVEWVRPRRSPERQVQGVDLGPWRFAIRP